MSDAKRPAKTSLTDALDSLPDATRAKVMKAAQDMKAADAAPSMKLSMKEQTLTISFDCGSVEIATLLQMVDIGRTDGDFQTGLVGQIASLGAQGHAVSSEYSNFVLSVVRSIKPRDELEAMLATQMSVSNADRALRASNRPIFFHESEQCFASLNSSGLLFPIQRLDCGIFVLSFYCHASRYGETLFLGGSYEDTS